MQFCKNCHKEVKYIATRDNYILCDSEIITIVTENGITKKGYKIHECKGVEDGGRREAKENT